MNQQTLSIYADLGAVYRPERVWPRVGRSPWWRPLPLRGRCGAWLLGLLLDLRLVLALGSQP